MVHVHVYSRGTSGGAMSVAIKQFEEPAGDSPPSRTITQLRQLIIWVVFADLLFLEVAVLLAWSLRLDFEKE